MATNEATDCYVEDLLGRGELPSVLHAVRNITPAVSPLLGDGQRAVVVVVVVLLGLLRDYHNIQVQAQRLVE